MPLHTTSDLGVRAFHVAQKVVAPHTDFYDFVPGTIRLAEEILSEFMYEKQEE